MNLKEHIELIEQALSFLNDYINVPHDILILKKHGDRWLEVAMTWNYTNVWSILTFYRCMEKLKKAKDYFDQPLTDTRNPFRAEYDNYKNIYYAKITDMLQEYETHYLFSKMMWDKFNEMYEIKNTPTLSKFYLS